MVAVAHPDLLAASIKPPFQKRQSVCGGGHEGASELGGAVACFDRAAKVLHHHLLAIADAKDRHAKVVDSLRRTR